MTTIQAFTHYMIGPTRNVLLGIGLAYAIEKKEYLHIPLVFVFPSIYVGYQGFTNREMIASWFTAKRI
jgi:hypothetical protein